MLDDFDRPLNERGKVDAPKMGKLLKKKKIKPDAVRRTDDRDSDVLAAITQIGAEIEWAIRQRPHQWFCFRRLWDA